MADSGNRPYYFLDTVGRAVKVLEQFLGSEAELGVSEIAERAGLNKSVVHRLLATLKDLGLLTVGSVDGTYRLGVRALELGLSYLRHSPIERVVQTHLLKLAQQLADMAFHVAILDGTDVVYQRSVSGPAATWVSATLGRRQQAYSTSLGKVLLAYLSPDELESYLSHVQLRPFTSNTITTSEQLRRELEVVRSREWACDNQENYLGRRCVGAPIRDHTGRVVAALSFAGLTEHYAKYGQENLVRMLKESALAISRDLGYASNK